MTEEFKSVIGYDNQYLISNLGSVISLKSKNPKTLSAAIDGTGYKTVVLCKKGKCTTKKIHQLVAEAFLNHKPCGFKTVVDHIDNDKLNNNLSNLQLLSMSENLTKERIKIDPNINIGISWYSKLNKWCARKRVNNKQIHIGYFKNKEDAINAYINF